MELEEIKKETLDYYNLPDLDFNSRIRKREFVEPRQMAMAITKHLNKKMSFKDIGYYFGRYDHSTVIYSVRTIKYLMFSSKEVRKAFNTIVNRLHFNVEELANSIGQY